MRCLPALRRSVPPPNPSCAPAPTKGGSRIALGTLWSSGTGPCSPRPAGGWGGAGGWGMDILLSQPAGHPELPAAQTGGAADPEECEKFSLPRRRMRSCWRGRGLGDAGRDEMSSAAAPGQRMLPIASHRHHRSVQTSSCRGTCERTRVAGRAGPAPPAGTPHAGGSITWFAAFGVSSLDCNISLPTVSTAGRGTHRCSPEFPKEINREF